MALLFSPTLARAAPDEGVGFFTAMLMLPFGLGLALALHIGLGRAAKALATSVRPLASELEAGGYQRQVYGTAQRAMLEVVGLVLAAGVVLWIGLAWGAAWALALSALLLAGALALDLYRWERVAVSANFVWFQRGLGQTVHQVAIENIRDVTVTETDVPGWLTLRHGRHNRLCRLQLRMNDKRVVALPKTDAETGLEAVEEVANLIRSRQSLLDGRQALARSERQAGEAIDQARRSPASRDKEMIRELKRLRQRALAPDVPPGVKMSGSNKG
jgi:hypothetical protein